MVLFGSMVSFDFASWYYFVLQETALQRNKYQIICFFLFFFCNDYRYSFSFLWLV